MLGSCKQLPVVLKLAMHLVNYYRQSVVHDLQQPE